MSFTIGSLFDGSGGFPLAASMCGGIPKWASEIEPYPIAVTKSRFPGVKHLGSVTDIKGDKVEPVDVITFGSPCQDLSVAGKRAGLKHEANGDNETTRSGLFMEAVRIIKEMRGATNGEYPRFALWENVPGAFSSNNGEDFRIVLEELIKIVEPSAVMPTVPKNGWPYADSYCGDGWSLAYRVLDAQYWGVPQHRRRIYLILDLRAERAREVLFEREGLRRDFTKIGMPWEAVAGNAANRTGADDCEREGNCLTPWDYQGKRVCMADGVFPILYSVENSGQQQQTVCVKCYDARGNGDGQMVSTLTGDHENRITDYTSVVCMAHGQANAEIMENKSPCLNCNHEQPIVAGVDCRNMNEYPELYPTLQAKPNGGQSLNFSGAIRVQYTVRRITPTECTRLQGFPDNWGHPDYKEDFTDDEYRFWLNVRNTHAAINGKPQKDYTKDQILKWYNGLHTDSSEYKMWGNGIALPNALYTMQGIADVMLEEKTEQGWGTVV